MTTIYALLDDNQVRYIGKTTQTDLDAKLRKHMLDAVSVPEKFPWIHELLKKGGRPGIRTIFQFEDSEAEYYEKLFMNHYKFFSNLRITQPDSFSQKRMQDLLSDSSVLSEAEEILVLD